MFARGWRIRDRSPDAGRRLPAEGWVAGLGRGCVMVIAWRCLRPWEIVVFWVVIVGIVVGTFALSDHVWDVSTRGPLRVIVPQFGMIDPCSGQGPLCVAA